MASYKSKALVLRSYRFKETDKILKLFSLESGIIDCIAKGVCSAKSKLCGRLELFNFIDCEISSGKNLDIITQAEIIESFEDISNDFIKFAYSQVISEIILKTHSGKTPEINLFKLAYITLRALNNEEKSNIHSQKKILFFFILKFLKITGYFPLLNSCSVCGSQIFTDSKKDESNEYFFSVKAGGFACSQCRNSAGSLYIINEKIFSILNIFPRLKIEEFVEIDISAENLNKLIDIFMNYLCYHADVSIDSFNYMKKIKEV